MDLPAHGQLLTHSFQIDIPLLYPCMPDNLYGQSGLTGCVILPKFSC